MSDDKSLPSKIKTEAVNLHNSGLQAGSLIEQSISRLDPDQAKHLMEKAVEEALRLEVKTREHNINYVNGKKAAEDHIETFEMLDKTGKLTRQNVVSDITTGAGKMRIESKSGATCFVASVAYDDPNHPDVMFLRFYRDNYLNKTQFGKLFISTYWKVGPCLALIVSRSIVLKTVSRKLISKLVLRLTNQMIQNKT